MAGVTVIGAGLAGCEAAALLARRGIKVMLLEMKPQKFSPAHTNAGFAELVCSNSLKAEREDSAAGLLKAELKLLGSICIEAAYACRVPAGGALAVDRDGFSAYITNAVKSHPLIETICEEARKIPEDGINIVATGPLTSDPLAKEIRLLCGGSLWFYDAAAPIVTAGSIDMGRAFAASRYDRGGDDDYINCPLDAEEYGRFYEALITAECAEAHGEDRERKVYEGCMPVEILAKRGPDTLRFGPMKPVGLCDPQTGHRPWAVAQLRREKREGSLYNMVGFQTNLKFGEQKRVFSMIPALANADFMRYGVMHRNTFIDSPRLLNKNYSLKKNKNIFFAGQITGVEGYMESAASGILAGINAFNLLAGKEPFVPPRETMTGALTNYITDGSVKSFQPMGANFGILPPLPEHIRDKRERYKKLSERAIDQLAEHYNR